MSWQGYAQQTPPLFLSQRQKEQLERSFTDPIRRQVTQLQAQIEDLQDQVEFWQNTTDEKQAEIDTLEQQVAALQAAGQWPDTDEVVDQDRSYNTNVILWFSFNGGSSATYILRYTNIESQTYGYLEIPSGTESALVIFNYNNNRINFYIDGALSTDLANVTEPRVEYNATSNNRIRAFY